MRVAVYHNNSDIRIEERSRPRAGPGELLLRVEASGLCGSDVMEWYRVPRAPKVLGHEIAGIVEQVGAGIEEYAVGNRVVATHHVPCDSCRYCATDRHSACETLRATSFDPGGFAEYVRLPSINVQRGTFLLPDNVSFAAGSFVEPLACVVRAQRLAGVRRGDSVAVLGSGISGILQIQLARVAGAERIIATDPSGYRREAALRFGADVALEAGGDDLIERVRASNGGRLPERVLVCTGARSAMEQALHLADRGGTILYFATLPPDRTLELPVNELWQRGVSIVHSYAGPPAEMRDALELIAEGKIDVESMITHRLPLAETGEGFRLLATAGESLKILIEPGR